MLRVTVTPFTPIIRRVQPRAANFIIRPLISTRRKRVVLALLASMWLPLLGTPSCFSQATTGAIVGQVTDPEAEAVPGAEVEAVNEATGLSQKTLSDAVGNYMLAKLPPGTYTITVSKQGFRVAKVSRIPLFIGQEARDDVQLQIGTMSEQITVVASDTGLQTQTAETGEVIQSRQILDLPLLGRNFLDLARLTPGVIGGSQGNSVNLAVNGQREFANSVPAFV